MPDQRKTIERILADPRYWDAKHPEHEAITAEATRAFREAYPDSPDGAATSVMTTIHVRGYTRRQNAQRRRHDRGRDGIRRLG